MEGMDAGEVARRLRAYEELADYVEGFVPGYCCRSEDYTGGYIDGERNVVNDLREILDRDKE